MRCWLLALVLGCGGGNGGGGNGPAKLKASLDLTHTIGFAISNAASPREAYAVPAGTDAGTCTPSTLFALQDDGTMVVTTVTETGNGGTTMCTTSTASETASALFDTSKYVVIDYSPNGLPVSMGTCEFVVLRKSDGALFCSPGNLLPTRVQGSGDVLVMGTAPLARLDMSVDPPTLTTVDDPMMTMDVISGFDANSANDALATGSFGIRVFKGNGGLVNLGTDLDRFQWTAANGTDFWFGKPSGNGVDVFQVDATYTATQKATFDFLLTMNDPTGIALVGATQSYLWLNKNSTPALMEVLPTAAAGVCRNGINPAVATCSVDGDCSGTTCSQGGVQHVVQGISTIRNAVGTGTTVYIQGTDSNGNGLIASVDTTSIGEAACCTTANCCPLDGCCSSPITPTILLAAGDYTLNAISLSKTGELTFAGLRNSDGAHVVGNCEGGTCTVLNASAPTVTALQRIN